MTKLNELIKQIPGLDPEITNYTPPPFKSDICDPVVITDDIQHTEKYCAPTTITDDQREQTLKDMLNKTEKMVADLQTTNASIPTATSHYNDACSTAYVKAIIELVNNDIILKNNSSQDIISKLPANSINFWLNMMSYVYCYTIASKLHADNKINNIEFNSIKFLIPSYDSSDTASTTYKSNLSKLSSSIESSIATINIESYVTDLQTVPDTIKTGISSIGKQFDNRISVDIDVDNLLIYTISTDDLRSGITHDFNNIFPIPTNDQIKNGNVKLAADVSLLQGAFDIFYSTINEVVKYASIIYYYGKYKSFVWSNFISPAIKIKDNLGTYYNQILSAYDMLDSSKMEAYVKSKLTAIKACGQSVTDTTNTAVSDTSTKNINHKTYSATGQPDFTQLKYWKIYSNIINTIGLLPQYWRVGLLIPTPAGIVKIPVPIIWKPLVVIPTPTTLIVVFITIDGMIVSPVIWTLTQRPIANAESKFLVLFRGANQSIKTDTGVKMLNPPIIDNQDVNPTLSRTLPFAADDLPAIERLTLTNPLLLVYINLWLSVATPFMGIP